MSEWSTLSFASIRVECSSLGIDEVSQLLNMQPSVKHADAVEMARKNQIWYYKGDIQRKRDLIEHIEDMLTFIQDRMDQFKHITKECPTVLMCAWVDPKGGSSFELAPKQFDILVNANIKFELQVRFR